MKKIVSLLLLLTLTTGCAESLALLGPASTSVTGGNVVQSSISSAVSYGLKKQTGKSPMEHAIAYAEKHNPEKKKSKCISFLESTESELCQILKKNISDTKNKIIKHKIVKSSKIEDLAKNSDIHKRR
tara:strand:+ start:30 stop:413 length:384 start_codon:yes stop_codon:yes gene_type:complete